MAAAQGASSSSAPAANAAPGGAKTSSSSSASTPPPAPLSLDIPAAAAISTADGSVQVPLKQSIEPREAGQPSLNATASPLPVTSAGVTPPLTTSGASRNSSNASSPAATSTGKPGASTKPSKQARNEANEDRGYEGEIETRGTGGDADDSDDTMTGRSTGRRPTLNKRGDSGVVHGVDHAEQGRNGLQQQPGQSQGRQQQLDEQEHPLSEHLSRKNRNPSQASHAHPTLPVRPGRHAPSAKGRSPSVSSARSVEATSHPFPTPGIKQNNGFQFDKWKSVEEQRLDEDERREKHWKRWGPYLSERQWVRARATRVSSLQSELTS